MLVGIYDSKKVWVMYGCILLLDLVQAGFTNLIFDEAYYWVGGQNMALGHFYYPPLIDVLSVAGYAIVNNELGLRLFFCIAHVAALILMERLLLAKDRPLYFLLVLSLLVFQVLGFFAVPDTLLLLLAVVFYTAIKRFVETPSVGYAIALGLVSALLLYTKYHGAVLIAGSFIFLVFRHGKKGVLYVWPVTAVLFFLPHLWWQYEHDFPTIMYHLFERAGRVNTDALNVWNIMDYIPGQVIFAGPLIGVFLFYTSIKQKVNTYFEKLLKFNIYFFYLFWFVISFTNHVEMNWGLLGLIPLVILAHQYIAHHASIRQWIVRLFIPSVCVTVFVRLLFFFPAYHTYIDRVDEELVGWKKWAHQIEQVAGKRDVVLETVYQTAAMFCFYSTRKYCVAMNANQINDFIRFFPYEDRIQGKDACYFSQSRITASDDSVITQKGVWYYRYIDNYRSYQKIRLQDMDKHSNTTQGKHTLLIKSPYSTTIDFMENPALPSTIFAKVWKGNAQVATIPLGNASKFLVPCEVDMSQLSALEEGKYIYQFFIKTGMLCESPCSRIFKYIVL